MQKVVGSNPISRSTSTHSTRMAVAGFVALALASCGDKATIDGEELEGDIAAGLERQADGEEASVSCPDEIQADEGDAFPCVARISAAPIPPHQPRRLAVTVTVTSNEGDVRWEARGPAGPGGREGSVSGEASVRAPESVAKPEGRPPPPRARPCGGTCR
jgi:hypothetical protein